MYQLKKYPFSSHFQIAQIIRKLKVKSVLDVGCSQGFLGQTLAGSKIYLEGIDENEKALKQALPHYNKLHRVDLNFEKPELLQKFDCIVFADVLEHLINPEKILKTYTLYLEKNGFIIISLPNIANIWIRLNLAIGRFEYSEKGILDKTHLHFYTLKTASELVKSSNLSLIDLKVTPIPLPLLSPLFSPGRVFYPVYFFLNWLTKIFKQLFAYQFIFLLQK